jgi:hypothetical protein
MAINKKIIKKLSEKTASDISMQKNLEEMLAGIEEGRQGKRIIEKMLKSL